MYFQFRKNTTANTGYKTYERYVITDEIRKIFHNKF